MKGLVVGVYQALAMDIYAYCNKLLKPIKAPKYIDFL